MSLRLPWPVDHPPNVGEGNLTAFELPVVARRPETALALLGGPRILAAHVYANLTAADGHASSRHTTPITVDLRLRPEDERLRARASGQHREEQGRAGGAGRRGLDRGGARSEAGRGRERKRSGRCCRC